MPQTEHYQLNQWEFEDQILMADFNNDNQKIDAALHELAGQIAKKADSAAVTNLTAVVNNKAEQSALAAEETARQNADNTEKAAREAADTALDKRAGSQLIKSISVNEAEKAVRAVFDDVDWGQWSIVHICFHPVLDSGTYTAYLNSDALDRTGRTGTLHIILYPMFDADSFTCGHFWIMGITNGELSQAKKLRDLELEMDAAGSSRFIPGTVLSIWGIR